MVSRSNAAGKRNLLMMQKIQKPLRDICFCKDMLGIALIGTGHIAQEHATALRRLRGGKFVAVYGRNPERVQAFARGYRVQGYTELSGLLKNPEIHIVDIANRNDEHGDVALQAIASGKHVILEKPMDVSIARAKKILQEAGKRGLQVSVISQYRFGSALQKVKKMIDEGRFGKLILGQVFLGKSRSQDYYDEHGGWRKNKQRAGGGVLLLNAVHYVDVLRWLLGEVKEVAGMQSTLTHHMPVEDTGMLMMKFQSGALGVISASTSLAFNIPDRIEVYGSKQSIVIEAGRITRMYRGNRVGSWIRSGIASCIPRSVGSIREQLQEIVGALENRKKPAVTGEDGLRVIEIIEKAYR